MIILGGEPPVVDNPEPLFGEVILKFNEIIYSYQEYANNFNTNIQSKLATLTGDLATFVTETVGAVDSHLNATGAVHGETKATIGLAEKDNFRTATLQEQVDLQDVDAFVTPQGAKQAFDENLANYNPNNYQKNDQFWFASLFHPNKYPTVTPSGVEPVRYLGGAFPKRVGMLFNADRLIFSPISDTGRYNTQFIFASLPTKMGVKGPLEEINSLRSYYQTTNWNSVAAKTGDGRIALFQPLVDRNVYEFADSLGIGGSNFTALLFRGFGAALHKGFGVSSSFVGTVVTINHRFFKADITEVDPAIENLVTGSYEAVYDIIGQAEYAAALNGSHTVDIQEFLSLPVGTTVTIQGGSNGPVLSLFWNVQDQEIYLHVAVPVRLSLDGVTNDIVVSFFESVVPGTLETGGVASITTVGSRSKDYFTATLEVPESALWCRKNDKRDLLNLVQYPGVLLSNGMVVKAVAGKYGMRVKRFPTQYTGLKQWLTSPPAKVDSKRAITTVYAPSRHSPFGPIPERIFPYNHTASALEYLIYGVNPDTGLYEWREASWMSEGLISTEVPGVKFGILPPDVLQTKKMLYGVPRAVVSKSQVSAVGVEVTGLGFSKANDYTGKVGFSYANGVLTEGTDVKLSIQSLATLNSLAPGVMSRAATANPLVTGVPRELQIQVFAISATKALVLITDGLCYAEAAVCTYTIASGVFTLNFGGTGLPTLVVVSQANQPALSGNRQSATGDDVWMEYSDLLINVLANGNYECVVTRPFGNLYGDLSFIIVTPDATPALTIRTMNPARLYPGTDYFDTVEELHPPLLIPKKGLYLTAPASPVTVTRLVSVSGTITVDPHDINEVGWVRIPAGARLVLGGAVYSLEREFSMKLPTTGQHYCYIVREGERLSVVGSTVKREVSNNEVCFGLVTAGVFVPNNNYLVMNNKVVSSERSGSAIPVFLDDGDDGVNDFFTVRDVT